MTEDAKTITYGSDFSGVGAFEQAIKRLGIPSRMVYACDWDKYARQTFIENYGQPPYFPEDFTWSVSDTQAYKQAGNSIVVRPLLLIL